MPVNRRTFLIGGGVAAGALLVGIGAAYTGLALHDRVALQRRASPHDEALLLAMWILVHPDSTVTLLSPHTEMGQGTHTGLRQIVADELDLDWEQIRVEQAPAATAFNNGPIIKGFILGDGELSPWFDHITENLAYLGGGLMNMQMTGGSASIRYTGWRSMRIAAAAAREMLVMAAGEQLGVPTDELTTRQGAVVHAGSDRSVPYGELVETAASLSLPTRPTPKSPEEWSYVGRSMPRGDLPPKVFGRAEYGIDRAVPGMAYAAVKGVSVLGASVTAVDNADEVTARRGVKGVHVVPGGVAVVADNPWRAEQAVRAVTFRETEMPHAGANSASLWADQEAALDNGPFSDAEIRGDVQAVFDAPPAGATVVEAEYAVPFLAHAPMEPMNATVWKEGDVVHVAAGEQNPLATRAHVAQRLGVDIEQVHFHAHTMGGGFGRRNPRDNGTHPHIDQALAVFEATGEPVKLTWSREEDTRNGTYRNASLGRYRGVVSADGTVLAWDSRTYGSAMPFEMIPPYRTQAFAARFVDERQFVPWQFWRSVDASIFGFYTESFVDELAAASRHDPLTFRLGLLEQDARLAEVLRAVGDLAPRHTGVDEHGCAYGVAAFECFGSCVAQVAKVSQGSDGVPRVHDVWAVVDCGIAVNPDAVEAQVQGGIIFGLTAARFGAIDIDKGGVVQSNFHDYRMIRMADAPDLHVRILKRDTLPGGVGEVSVPQVAPVVANALAQLGSRPRRLPLG